MLVLKETLVNEKMIARNEKTALEEETVIIDFNFLLVILSKYTRKLDSFIQSYKI